MPLFKKLDTAVSPKSTTAPRDSLSIIGLGVQMTGDILCAGVLKIEGQLEGSVRGPRQLLLGRNGVIRGDVEVEEAVLGGTVHGNIAATARVEIQNSAKVLGNVQAHTLVVAEGARIAGLVHTADDEQTGHSSLLKFAASG